MRVEFTDYEQELICFLINLLKTIDLSKFPPNDEYGLRKYISVSITNKHYELKRKKLKEINNCADVKEEVFDIAVIAYSKSKGYLGYDLLQKEELIALKEGLSKLTKKQKEVIFLKYTCDLSDIEIGKKIGITRQSVNQILRRAYKILENYLQGR